MKNNKYGKCYGCKIEIEKKEFKRKNILGQIVYVCGRCGYYNSPAIFEKK